jgi:hypothetical protein
MGWRVMARRQRRVTVVWMRFIDHLLMAFHESAFPAKELRSMSVFKRFRWQTRLASAGILALAFTLLFPMLAFANVSLTQLSSDPFTQATCAASTTTNHHTEVEPDTDTVGKFMAS